MSMSIRGVSGGKPNRQILEEASAWFVDFREGDADAERRNTFNVWLRTSPEHIRAYLEVAAFWADVPQSPSAQKVDVDSLVAHALAEDNVVALEPPPVPRSTAEEQDGREGQDGGRSRRVAIAASVLIACITALFGAWYATYRTPTYSTDIGEQRSIVLADGSIIELNARTRARVRFTESARAVDLLEGQALFKVTKDAARPFIVYSEDTRVRAVGTQFDVYRRKTGTTVTVLEGRVAVFSPTAAPSSPQLAPVPGEQPRTRSASQPADEPRTLPPAVELAAGEQARVTPTGVIEASEGADVASATAWMRRQVVFRGTPLTDVVEEFNRYNARQMIIADAAVETVRISGVFSSTDPTLLLRFLRELPNFDVRESDTQIVIARKQEI